MIGRTLAHFRVLDRLGAGGMGVVYLAEDLKLQRRVALKVLPANMSSHPERLARFEREARAAAVLNHPNIVTVYSVEEAEGVHFFTMEWVPGKTLAEMIPPEGLPLPDLLSLAIPLADALHTAHESGIIHRDLKPRNLMVTADGRVKILDFGLAKLRPETLAGDEALSSADGLTRTGLVVGTAPYMSPEQVQGKALDHRTDLFSLGGILYEMATGSRPFDGESAADILAGVLRDTPRSVSELRPGLPRELGRIISRCLQKDPDRRYQSARELRQELEDLKRESESGGALARPAEETLLGTVAELPASLSEAAPLAPPPSLPAVPAVSPGRRWLRPALIAAPLVLIGVLAAVYFFAVQSREAFSFQERDSIVLGSFQNLTQDPLLDDSLELAFRVGLEQSRYARVLPASQVRTALQRMEREPDTPVTRDLGIELCQREGARALVLGSVAQIGGSYTLSGEIVDPRTDRTVFTRTERAADRDHLLDALESLTREVRSNLGESLAQIEKTSAPLEKATTGDLQALKAYSVAIRSLAQGKEDEAIELLERAVELDPEFATAHAKLGTVYNNFQRSRSKAAEHWEIALRLGDRLSGSERLYIEGSRAWQGEPVEMLRIWSSMSALHPEQIVAHHNLGCVYWWYQNDFARAAAAFARAAAIRDPLQYISYSHLGYCQLGLGRTAEALRSFETSWKMSETPLQSGLADVYTVLGRYRESKAFLDRAVATSTGFYRVDALCRLSELWADQGKLRQAVAAADEASRAAEQSAHPRGVSRAMAARLAALEKGPDLRRFRAALAAAVSADLEQLAADPTGLGPNPTAHAGLLGKLSARNGDAAAAREILRRLRPLPARQGASFDAAWHGILEGEIALAEGRPGEARAHLLDALELADLFQIHESLARACEAAGDLDCARREIEWMLHHRGQAFAEWLDQFYGKGVNVVDWALSRYHLARLAEARGEAREAVQGYTAFLEHWQGADGDVPVVAEAARRLRRLQAGTPSQAGLARDVRPVLGSQGIAVR